ncbi:MAG: 3-methyl-2-oxobutanoate hydroxymethyltransferase [Lentisphaeria bacterium]|nr:3-methyl-2-oxobutanoate hydroxymethyltransferase [Lentisphaeria bacterium]NQZ67785.1 3-methyl-2-oxobutanoate hydroxymethyltransferase [Lentisphaeria bacterium]
MADSKTTIRSLMSKYKAGEKLVAITAYDALQAKILDPFVDIILVGDSLGMTALGYATTLEVTIEQSLHHTAAVSRGIGQAFLVGDMPFMTFGINDDESIRNAGRYLKESGAQAVKLEGGQKAAPLIRKMVSLGIPVMGHIGLLPQHVNSDGGYHVHGKEPHEASALMDDAKSLEEAGVFSIVIEGVPADLGVKITDSVNVPTIGIGAGAGCSGQIQVLSDILGMDADFKPQHARQYADLADIISGAIDAYATDIRSGEFPSDKESFK